MKLIHYALAFMLLLTACSKDDEKTQESFTSYEGTWTRDSNDSSVTINSTEAHVSSGCSNTGYYHTWFDYGEIGSLQDIDIYNIPIISEVDYSSIPIKEHHGYIKRTWPNGSLSYTPKYYAFYITKIHRDKNGNILYIKYQQREFIPYERWI